MEKLQAKNDIDWTITVQLSEDIAQFDCDNIDLGSAWTRLLAAVTTRSFLRCHYAVDFEYHEQQTTLVANLVRLTQCTVCNMPGPTSSQHSKIPCS